MKYLKLKFLLMFFALAMAIPPAWAAEVTLTNQNIYGDGTSLTGYSSWTMTDGNGNSWSAYAIKKQHSNATSSFHFLQIKKYESNTAYYIQVPVLGTKITKIVMTVSNTNNPMGNGGNNATLFFSSLNSTSATGNGVASGTGSASVTIDCSNLNLNTGYITTTGAVRIWDVTVTYDDTPSTDPWVTVNPSSLNINQNGGTFTVKSSNIQGVDNNLGVTAHNGFICTGTATKGYWHDDGWGFVKDENGDVDGTVSVTYGGRALKASDNIEVANYFDSKQVTVNYLYDGDIYIVGNVDNYSWNEPVAGVLMDKNADGTYSKTITANGGNDGYAYLYFTKSIDAANYNALGNNSFGPLCTDYNNQPIGGQTWTLTESTNGIFCALDANSNLNTFKLEPGQYTFTINPATNQFKITKVLGPVTYVKVTSTDDVTSGNYLIVYEEGGVAFDGSRTELDAAHNHKSVTIKDGAITTSDAIYFTYDATTKTLKSASGLYIGRNSYSNGMDVNASTQYTNTIEIDDDENADITASGNCTLRFNSASGDSNDRFRYYKSGQQAIQLYKEFDPNKVIAPTFSPAAGTYTEVQHVEISCATEGATIYYTTDGSEPTTASAVYRTAIEVAQNMTIKAMAVKEGMTNSNVATAEYTINLPITVSTLAAANALEENDDDVSFTFTENKVVVTFKKSYTTGNNNTTHTLIGLRDQSENNAQGKGGSVFYNISASIADNLEQGTVLNPNWKARTSDYNGWVELIGASNVDTQEQTVTVEPFDRTGVTLTKDNQSEYIILKNVTISNNGEIATAGGTRATYNLFDRFNLEYEDGNYESLIGVVNYYKTQTTENVSIYPLELKKAKVATPTFDPAPQEEAFTAVQNVTIACATESATIYYTTDGTEPTAESAVYSQPIVVNDGTTTIKAIAMKDGMTNSEVVTATYTVNLPTLEAPTFDHESNTYDGAFEVTITAAQGATIHYTTDGTEPTAESPIYEARIPVNKNMTIKAIAVKEGYKASDVATAEYQIKVAKPTFSPVAGTYDAATQVSIVCGTEEATIHYTTDGTEPTAESAVYSEAIAVNSGTMTIKAIAVKEDMANSDVAEAVYTIRQNAELEFKTKQYTVYVGDDFIAPTLGDIPEGLTVTYSSDNEEVAVVDENTGEVVIGDKTGTATITASWEATDTYTAGYATYTITVEAKPHVTADPTSLDFEAVIGQDPVTETFTVMAKNLKGDITLTMSESEVFTIAPATITMAEAMTENGKTVTVTYNPTAVTGEDFDEATVTIKSTDADDVKVKLTGMATLPDPELTVSTETLEMGTNPTGTFTVTGQHLTENVTVSIKEGSDAGFSVAPTSIEATNGAIENATVTVTYSGTSTTDAIATVVVKSGTVSKDVIVSARVLPTPVIIIDEETLDLGTTGKGTFDIMAEDLRGDITLTCDNENFTVSPTTITPEEAEEGATVTVTYTGDNTEVETATITITTDGIDEPITKTVTAKAETYVALAAPTFAPAAGTYTEAKEVAIACATPGVTITYAIDGVDKGKYNGPFTISDGEHTVTATAMMGTRTVYTPATSSATYKINAASAATIADDYYFLQSNAAEVSGKYANVAGRRTLNFVADPDDKAGTIFRIKTDPDTVGQIETLRSQAVDLQGYANRAMAYVPKAIELVLSTLANSSLGDPETPGTGILGENGLDLILNKFYEGFDYNLYVEQADGGYRIYGRTPSMQHVVDFYHENTAQVEEKLPMLEGYINQVLDKIRNKVGQAGMNEGAIPEFSLKTVRDRIAEKNGITLIDPVNNDSKMEFYSQVLNNKEYVWDFAYQTAMIYVDAIKQTGTYENLPNEYKLFVEKMEKVRPDTKYYIIERGNELDYISENNGDIISNDPRTLWTLTKREKFTVNVPEANKLNDSYYTTLYTDFAYTLPEGVNAYAVTGIDENDVAQLTEITGAIPAQTPVLLMAKEAKDYVLTLSTEAGTAVEGNLLVGPDYLIKTYGITSPTVEMLFNMAAGFVPAETLADYEYLKLRTSGTVNNKYMWALSKEEIYKCGTPNEYDQVTETVIRRLVTNEGTLAFSDQWNTETNKAFLVSDTKPVIYLEKETLAAPTFSPVPGSYTAAQEVNITAEGGATIMYSTDGGKTWNTYKDPIAVSDDMTIVAKAEKDGMIASNEVTAVYVIDIPAELPDVPVMKGYFQIMNNGNEKYAHVQGRKTLTFTDAPADKAGTVIWLETNNKGQVQSLRSQAADLQRYADRAMSYVPEIVELVADKLNADGSGQILGEHGLEKIMEKFKASFDHHLYVEQVENTEGGYRIYGKTPSMQPVVEFYRENTAQVEAKLPMLEDFINSALNKLKEKIGGQSVFTEFKLHDIWQKMGGTLTEPNDDASTMAFYREVLNNKNYVWDFAYQTAMIYINNLINHDRWSEVEEYLGEYAQYIDKIDQIRPDFKYYVVADGNKPDFISEGNVDIKNNAARTIWTLEDRTDFSVNIADNLFGCPLAGVGGYATTLYTDFAYTVPNGVTAYKVTSIDGGNATIEPLSGVIPAQTPVLLTAKEAGTVTLTLSTEAGTAVTGNLLVGPDYLINEYDLKTTQVQELFDKIKEMLGQDFYDAYVAQYEHLADLNSGTVNNKYFWGLKQEDVLKCGTTDEYDRVQCVVRSLEDGKFVNNLKVETNKAFLVTDEYAEIMLNNLRGDVNHDGLVNIEDVTDLIDRLLGMPDAYHLKACEYCSDVNKNGTVKIDDVTTLIDILLGIDGSNQATDPQGGE